MTQTISQRFNYHFITDEDEAEFNAAFAHLTDEEADELNEAAMGYHLQGNFDGFIITVQELADEADAYRIFQLLFERD